MVSAPYIEIASGHEDQNKNKIFVEPQMTEIMIF
jgi:hypothetical protein